MWMQFSSSESPSTRHGTTFLVVWITVPKTWYYFSLSETSSVRHEISCGSFESPSNRHEISRQSSESPSTRLGISRHLNHSSQVIVLIFVAWITIHKTWNFSSLESQFPSHGPTPRRLNHDRPGCLWVSRTCWSRPWRHSPTSRPSAARLRPRPCWRRSVRTWWSNSCCCLSDVKSPPSVPTIITVDMTTEITTTVEYSGRMWNILRSRSTIRLGRTTRSDLIRCYGSSHTILDFTGLRP